MKQANLIILLMLSVMSASAQRLVRGTVIDASGGQPLAGATVQVAGTARIMTCDADGKFSIQLEEGLSIIASAMEVQKRTAKPAKHQLTDELEPVGREVAAAGVSGTMKAVTRA